MFDLYGQRTFWAKGYYVSTVGLNKNTIKKYIQNQELEDRIEDKKNIKEYQDPFKGVGRETGARVQISLSPPYC